jgi:serine/threonine protein kinase/uncharacterized tellurite resistance protein B-like protein
VSRVERFRILAVVAFADGELSEAECSLLLRCASWLGLSLRAAKRILVELSTAESMDTLRVPSDPEERRRLFQGLINVALADGKLTQREEMCLLNMAAHFRITGKDVADMLERALTRTQSSRQWPRDWNHAPVIHETDTSVPTLASKEGPADSGRYVHVIEPLEIGDVLAGKFRIEELLGVGAFGTVFRAHHADLDEDVAVKVLNPDMALRPEIQERFLREVKTTRALIHRYAVPLREFGKDPKGRLYFTMDLVSGETLQKILEFDGPIPPDRIIKLATQILEVLSEAHRVGVVHRDLKPGNLMVKQVAGGKEEIRVVDFGIAKAFSDPDPGLTQAGRLVGTLAYMSPEQVLGRKLDGRSDLYALGVVLYEALSGEVPSDAERDCASVRHSVLFRIVSVPPTDLKELCPKAPGRLCDVIHRALAKEPADRFRDAEEMRQALIGDVEVEIETSPTRRLGSWIRTRFLGDDETLV